MTLYSEITHHIIGRLAIKPEEADVLEWLLKGQAGLHIEIGTLWGGTAVLAALAKGRGKVITIDYMKGGYWSEGDPDVLDRPCPSLQAILDNLAAFKVDHMVEVVKAPSYPWPLTGKEKPVSVLIDGGHDYESCLHDWQTVKGLAKRHIFFHDYATGLHPGVQRVVDEVVKKDPTWQLHGVYQTLAVFERT